MGVDSDDIRGGIYISMEFIDCLSKEIIRTETPEDLKQVKKLAKRIQNHLASIHKKLAKIEQKRTSKILRYILPEVFEDLEIEIKSKKN